MRIESSKISGSELAVQIDLRNVGIRHADITFRMKLRIVTTLVIALLSCGLECIAQQRAPVLRPAETERYLIQPGDTLEIQYRYTPEFNQTIVVQPDGYISLQTGADVHVGGLNLTQAKADITKQASLRLQDPVVTVILKDFQKPYVVVSGEVAQPGKFELRERLTAIQAVMLAGGLKDTARSSEIVVFRKLNLETAEVKVVNLKNLSKSA